MGLGGPGALASLVAAGGRDAALLPRVAWLFALAVAVGLAVAGRPRWSGERLARLGVVLAAVHASLAGVVHAASVRAVQGELVSGGVGPVVELMVGPVPADLTRWDVVARTGDGYRHGRWSWLPRPELELRGSIPLPDTRDPRVAAALRAPGVRGTVAWMRFPFVEVEPVGDGHLVHLMDARYVRRRSRGFGTARVRLDAQGRAVSPR